MENITGEMKNNISQENIKLRKLSEAKLKDQMNRSDEKILNETQQNSLKIKSDLKTLVTNVTGELKLDVLEENRKLLQSELNLTEEKFRKHLNISYEELMKITRERTLESEINLKMLMENSTGEMKNNVSQENKELLNLTEAKLQDQINSSYDKILMETQQNALKINNLKMFFGNELGQLKINTSEEMTRTLKLSEAKLQDQMNSSYKEILGETQRNLANDKMDLETLIVVTRNHLQNSISEEKKSLLSQVRISEVRLKNLMSTTHTRISGDTRRNALKIKNLKTYFGNDLSQLKINTSEEFIRTLKLSEAKLQYQMNSSYEKISVETQRNALKIKNLKSYFENDLSQLKINTSEEFIRTLTLSEVKLQDQMNSSYEKILIETQQNSANEKMDLETLIVVTRNHLQINISEEKKSLLSQVKLSEVRLKNLMTSTHTRISGNTRRNALKIENLKKYFENDLIQLKINTSEEFIETLKLSEAKLQDQMNSSYEKNSVETQRNTLKIKNLKTYFGNELSQSKINTSEEMTRTLLSQVRLSEVRLKNLMSTTHTRISGDTRRNGLQIKNLKTFYGNEISRLKINTTKEMTMTTNRVYLASGWIKASNNYLYKSFTDYVTYSTAKARCMEFGARLISSGVRTKNVVIPKLHRGSGGSYMWIGLDDIRSEGTWVWSDGRTTTNYDSIWAHGEPNDVAEDCGAISSWGVHDYPCDNSIPYACEREF
uniref:C-type lectin domain family 4 member F-like n=1 Tax=Styela clava TaxID=7725 RepID=UPI00193999BD|nr:C-type lectin domain family 4 member F-like [Styela clava]